MDRLERLLDLVHVLQSAHEPLTFSQLKDRFADYAEGQPEAVRRKFERDKAELARRGLVIRYHDEEETHAGYLLDVAASYLPKLTLTPEERGLLATAARAALAAPSFPHRDALRMALAKLGTAADADGLVALGHRPLAPEGAGAPDLVERLGRALADRKRVHLRYRKPGAAEVTEREVAPYGLFLRAGAWYLVAHDGLRDAVRVFRVARIEDATVNAKRPATPDYALPDDFDLEPLMHASPLHYAAHGAVAARVRVAAEVAFLAARWWGSAPDADDVFTVETTNLDALVAQVLELGTRAELLSPPEGRAAMRRALGARRRGQEGAA